MSKEETYILSYFVLAEFELSENLFFFVTALEQWHSFSVHAYTRIRRFSYKAPTLAEIGTFQIGTSLKYLVHVLHNKDWIMSE